MKNIVLFGQSGAGKSSLVNLMAGKDVALTSNDLERCTLQWQQYSISFDGESYTVFDTVGLDGPQLEITEYLDAVENAYKLTQHLEAHGGIDLLLFCMRAGRLTDTLRNNYRLFHEFLCDSKVPIIVAVTYLESEPGKMEKWWERNEKTFRTQQIHVVGHACITTKRTFQSLYEESRITIRDIIKQFTADEQRKAWVLGGNNMFVLLMLKLKQLLVRNSHAKKITPRLIKRCGLPPDVAERLASRINKDVVDGAT